MRSHAEIHIFILRNEGVMSKRNDIVYKIITRGTDYGTWLGHNRIYHIRDG